MHNTPGPYNSLFESERGMDGNLRFQFQGQALLFSERSTLKRNTLILGRDERNLRNII